MNKIFLFTLILFLSPVVFSIDYCDMNTDWTPTNITGCINQHSTMFGTGEFLLIIVIGILLILSIMSFGFSMDAWFIPVALIVFTFVVLTGSTDFFASFMILGVIAIIVLIYMVIKSTFGKN